jgi:hypothetical protein
LASPKTVPVSLFGRISPKSNVSTSVMANLGDHPCNHLVSLHCAETARGASSFKNLWIVFQVLYSHGSAARDRLPPNSQPRAASGMGLRFCPPRGALDISEPCAGLWPARPDRRSIVSGRFNLGLHDGAVSWAKFCSLFLKRNEPFQVLATLMGWTLSFLVNRPVRDPMISIIPIEVVWLSTGFIMLMAAFLAGAAE